MGKTYIAFNGPMPTTAAVAKVATGTSIKTLMQLMAGATTPMRVIEWGISFDGTAAATPGVVELVDTGTTAATVTAFVAADLMPHNDPNAPATQAQIGSTTKSGYTSSSEGSTTAIRIGDTQLIAPTGQYIKQFPLGREFEVKAGDILRIRTTFATTVNALCYIVWEE